MREKIIIVGAGINGLLSAYYLLKQTNIDIEIYDRDSIPNPISASFGKHRLIHPWDEKSYIKTAKKAFSALSMWHEILNEIGSTGFEQTGIFVLSDNNIVKHAPQNIETRSLSTNSTLELMPFVKGTNSSYIYHFPQFGVLFAEKILIDLSGYLRKNGVRFYEGCSAVSIDLKKTEARFSDGKVAAGDGIILSAGSGSNIIDKSFFHDYEGLFPTFSSQRCYVVYVEHSKIKSNDKMPAWASLGKGDVWGMPPLRGIPMKLGCGDFTKPCAPEKADDSRKIGEKIVERYIQMFPQLEGLSIVGYGLNHWAKIESESDHLKANNSIIVTSDNGVGFKFAPQTALNVVNSLVSAVKSTY